MKTNNKPRLTPEQINAIKAQFKAASAAYASQPKQLMLHSELRRREQQTEPTYTPGFDAGVGFPEVL